MAEKKNSEPEELDDLLGLLDEDSAGPAEPVDEDEFVDEEEEILTSEIAPEIDFSVDEADEDEVDEEEEELLRLQAELAKPAPKRVKAVKVERPVPEADLTPKQKKIRDLQDQVARKKAKELEEQEAQYEDIDDARDLVEINFVGDGFTALGQVWYRGQEIIFDKNGRAYADTFDREGVSWLESMIDDEDLQIERYGEVMFRRGPWRGKRLKDEIISDDERRRRNAAPIFG